MTTISAGTSSFLSRLLPLPIDQAGRCYDKWVGQLPVRPADPAVAGQLRLSVVDPLADPCVTALRQPWQPARSAPGEIRSPRGRLLGRVSLELASWSERRTEVSLRLTGRPRSPGAQYFAVGHAALGQVVAELEATAGLRPPWQLADAAISRTGSLSVVPVRGPVRPVRIVVS